MAKHRSTTTSVAVAVPPPRSSSAWSDGSDLFLNLVPPRQAWRSRSRIYAAVSPAWSDDFRVGFMAQAVARWALCSSTLQSD